MRRLLIITVTLCLLTLSASAWAGPGNHRAAAPGYAKHVVVHRSVAKGPAWGHRAVPRHPAPQWAHRPGHRYGQRHVHRSRYVARRCEPDHRRPVVVHERSLNRGSVLEYSIRIRTAN